jgi:hypothetical protein
MVAKRDDVGARREQAVRELRRDPDAVGDVLAVQDAEVGLNLLAEAGQALLDCKPSRAADNVRNKENLQGRASVAAG